MKKIIVLLLAASMTFSACSFAFAAEYERGENFEEMSGLLYALNIIDDNYEISSRELSRAEFLSLIIKSAGMGDYIDYTPSVLPFSDVGEDNPYAASIMAARDKNIALGYTDGSFRPDDKIALIEAIVYLVRLMGYTDVAEASGGYPAGYYYAASNNKLIKGVSMPTNEYVTAETAVNLLFDALNANILGQKSIKSDASSVSLTKGETLMYESFKVRKITGIMEEVDISALVGPNDLPPYNISVNGTQIDVGMLKPNKYLGYNVTAYYKEDNDLNLLVYVCEQYGKNRVKRVELSDITSISDYTVISSGDGGSRITNKYSPSAAIIFNGAATKAPFNTSIYSDENGDVMAGYIELLDNNNDGSADVVFVNAYYEFIAGKKDSATNTLYDAYDPSRSFVLNAESNDPYTKIYDEDGDAVTLGKIKTDMSVVIQESKADAYQGYIRAYYSDKKISGKLEQYTDGSPAAEVVINGNSYKLSSYGKKYYNPNLLGTKVEGVLNIFGEITMIFKPKKGSEQIGILRGVKQPQNIEDGIEFQIIDELGNFGLYKPSRYLNVDNRTDLFDTEKASDISNITAIFNAAAAKMSAGAKLNLLILYKLNDEGLVTSVDTILNSSGEIAKKTELTPGDSLCFEEITEADPTLDVGTSSDAYFGYSYKQSGQYVINRKFIVSDGTKVFLYPAGETGGDYYVSVVSKIFKPGYRIENPGFYAYYTDKDSVLADGLFIPDEGYTYFLSSSTANLSMIKKVTDIIDGDGNRKKKVYIYTNNNLDVFECDPELQSLGEQPAGATVKIKDLQPGDIIFFAVDEVRNTIGEFYVKYIAETDTIYNSNYTRGDTVSKQQFLKKAYPYIVSKEGMHYVETGDPADVFSLYSQGIYRGIKFDTISVTVLDYGKGGDNRVLPGGYDNILGYTDSETKCSEMLIHGSSFSYYLPKSIFVIRR